MKFYESTVKRKVFQLNANCPLAHRHFIVKKADHLGQGCAVRSELNKSGRALYRGAAGDVALYKNLHMNRQAFIQTYTTENITFLRTTYAGGNKLLN